ncbi:MAG TPA: SMP-30/gluconolactonase/LRE family protein [Ruminiclostridium sp.]
MNSQNLVCVHKGICHLGEGPIWNVKQQKLFWTDIIKREIWIYDPVGNSSRIFWKGNLQVGGFAFTRRGAIVLCSDKGIYLLNINSDGLPNTEPSLLFDIPLSENEMFNDITVDPEGRIFAGTVSRPDFTNGTLYCIEKRKNPVVVLNNLYCSNGMTFSLDEKYFFHTDSNLKRITKYDYDSRTGEISNPGIYFQGTSEIGSPDGITLDSQNHMWVAFWGGSCVRRLDTAGKVVAEISLPVKQPSSVMFGGYDLNELYITSACENADNISTGYCNDGTFLGGPLYKICPGVTGRAEWLADF